MQLPVARGRERHPAVTGIFILLGVILGGALLLLALSTPESNGITASYSDTDPHFVLVTPSSGIRSGKLFYVMNWDDNDFTIHPTQNVKLAQKAEIKQEWDGADLEFRLASPKEAELLHLPYAHTFKTEDGTTTISITQSQGAVTIHRSTGNRTRTCTYSPDRTGPHFQY
jgi:hypothetical protein